MPILQPKLFSTNGINTHVTILLPKRHRPVPPPPPPPASPRPRTLYGNHPYTVRMHWLPTCAVCASAH